MIFICVAPRKAAVLVTRRFEVEVVMRDGAAHKERAAEGSLAAVRLLVPEEIVWSGKAAVTNVAGMRTRRVCEMDAAVGRKVGKPAVALGALAFLASWAGGLELVIWTLSVLVEGWVRRV